MGKLSDRHFGGDLFGYPHTPGWRDQVTSRMAAEEIKESASTLRGIVLAAICQEPATVHEIARRLGRPVSSVQPRFSELLAFGRIRWNGYLRVNPSSRKRAKVWAAVTTGDSHASS